MEVSLGGTKVESIQVKGNRSTKIWRHGVVSVGPKFMERGVNGTRGEKGERCRSHIIKALLRSLDFYPVNNGEPVKGFKQRNIWIISAP